MSHQLLKNDKMVSGKGIVPWHFNQTGQDGRATVINGLLHPSEVVERFLNWKVLTGPVYGNTLDTSTDIARIPGNVQGVPAPSFLRIPNFQRIYRSDDPSNTLDITGKVFEPMQNDRLAEIIAALTGNKANVETAGSLFGGKIVWFLVPLRETSLPGGDAIKNFLLVSDGKCGNRKLEFRLTSVRAICWNTFTAAVQEVDATISLKHSLTTETRLQSRFDAVKWGNAALDAVFADYERMAATPVTKAQARKAVNQLFGDGKNDVSPRTTNVREEVYNLFLHGQGNLGKTAWHLFQAVTEHCDWSRSTRVTEGNSEADLRFFSNLFGSGNAIKQKAFAAALQLCEVGEGEEL